MDRQFIDDNQIIERYLAGRLTLEETDAFEVYVLEHDEVLEDIEVVRALRAGVRGLGPEERNEEDRPAESAAREPAWYAAPLRMAAGFVLAVSLATSGVFLLRQGSETGPDYESMVIELTVVRGAGGAEPVDYIELPEDAPRMLEFPIPLHGLAPDGVQVTLASFDEPREPIDRRTLRTGGADTVVYSILSTELPPGRYSLRVETDTGFLLADYSFRLNKIPH